MKLCAGLSLLLAACTSVPRPTTALDYLVQARSYLDAGEAKKARFLLEGVDESSFQGEDLARYKVTLAEADYATGGYFDAFEVLKDFPQKFWTSRLREQAEAIQFDAGRQLAASGWTLLGLWSDLDDARQILEHFITYYPRSRHLPDALRILGEAAYQQRDYEMAIERFSQLAQKSPDSGWADLASFRIAMSHFRLLEGSEYDGGQMERARQELTGYLQSPTTNEDFLREAREALATTLRWIEEKHLRVARFYLTIRQPAGARYHLQRVLDKPDPLFGDEARRLMGEVEALERSRP